jgi:hypothetical protein
MRRVIVHIERLVLKDFRREDRDAIAAGLEQELGRVFADRAAVSLLGAMGDVPRLQLGGVNIAYGASAQGIGESVAQRVGQEVKK